jgi:anthranilate phosphoribosyltransferase
VTAQEAIDAALAGKDLTRAEMADVIGQIMDGQVLPAQIAGLLVALRAKGEAIEELVGAATAMRERALPLECPHPDRSIDTCGTGGDGAGTVNISTLAAILIAACGGCVAKHGNRAQSSKCGSADVIEALGVIADAEPTMVERSMAIAGIGFAYAPRFHAATRHAAGPRKEIGTRTIFNLLGPLTNPARVKHQVVGVFDPKWCEPMAAALGALGVRRAAVVHGDGGLDEISVRGTTHLALWDQGEVKLLELSPATFGCEEIDPAGLAGGDAAHNAQVIRKVLAGHHIDHGERLEPVLCAAAMTAALALELIEPDPIDLVRLMEQYRRAEATAHSGAARLVLHKWGQVMSGEEDTGLTEIAVLKPNDFKGIE